MGEWAVRQQSGTDTAQRLRVAESGLLLPTGPLTSKPGVVGLGVGAASGMSRPVAPGRAWVQGGAAAQGGYGYVLDAQKTVTFDVGDSQARVDLVVVRVWQDAVDSTGQTKAEITIVKGAPGAGAPAVPTSSVVLYEQPVPANASAGTGGLTTAGTDRRPGRITAAGGIPDVADQNARDALDVYDGLIVYRRDLKTYQARQEGVWRALTVTGVVGKVDTTGAGAATTGLVTVTYPAAFAAALAGAVPIVAGLNAVVNTGAGQYHAGSQEVGTTSMKVATRRLDGGNVGNGIVIPVHYRLDLP